MKSVAGKFVLESLIASGSSATIYKARTIVPYPPLLRGSAVALKLYNSLYIPFENITKDIKKLKCIDHLNIAKYYGFEEDKNLKIIVMEYCESGDLYHFIDSLKSGLSESLIQKFIYQIASAMNYMKSFSSNEHNGRLLFNFDLKPQNILLSGSHDSPIIKLACFSLSNMLNITKSNKLTYIYKPPEIQRVMIPFGSNKKDENLSSASVNGLENAESWALGVVIYEMLIRNNKTIKHSQKEIEKEMKKVFSFVSLENDTNHIPTDSNVNGNSTNIISFNGDNSVHNDNSFNKDSLINEYNFNNINNSKDYNSFEENYDLDLGISLPNYLSVSVDLKEMVEKLLVFDPQRRIKLNDLLQSDLLQKKERNQKFSFIRLESDYSNTEKLESLLAEAVDSAQTVVAHLTECQKISNFLLFEILTKISEFLIDFLNEYLSLKMSNSTEYQNKELIGEIMEIVTNLIAEGEVYKKCLNKTKTDNKENADNNNSFFYKSESKENNISATQFLYEKGIGFAKAATEAEEKNEPNYIKISGFMYKKARAMLMPIVYEICDGEFIEQVRDVYIQIKKRKEELKF